MAVSKVIYESLPLIDLQSDTAQEDKVLDSYTFHDKTGTAKTGTAGASVTNNVLSIPSSQGSVENNVLSLE